MYFFKFGIVHYNISIIFYESSAFCAVRPPGHHAESNKACGFCFLNNAGIAAMHAHVNYGVERVAVLDFDVHHGDFNSIQFNLS